MKTYLEMLEKCLQDWVNKKLKELERKNNKSKAEKKFLEEVLNKLNIKKDHCSKYYEAFTNFDDVIERIFKNIVVITTRIQIDLELIHSLINTHERIQQLKNLEDSNKRKIQEDIERLLEELVTLYLLRIHAFIDSIKGLTKITCGENNDKLCLTNINTENIKKTIEKIEDLLKCSTRNRILHPPLVTIHIFPRENKLVIDLRLTDAESIASFPWFLEEFIDYIYIFTIFLTNLCILTICNCQNNNYIEFKNKLFNEFKDFIEASKKIAKEIEKKENELTSFSTSNIPPLEETSTYYQTYLAYLEFLKNLFNSNN